MIKEDLQCSCGFTRCHKCEDQSHSPLKCATLKEWKDLIMKDEEKLTQNYKNCFTKKCPRC